MTLGAEELDTQHLLLGLAEEPEGIAGRVLENLGLTPDRVREETPHAAGPGPLESGMRVRQIPFTAPAKKTFELALREALALGRNEIGTEHLLLGLLREGDNTALRVLQRCGLEAEMIRERTLEIAKEAQENHARTVDMDRSWLDFNADEALALARRLTSLASRINLEVRRHGDAEPSFRLSCELLSAKHVLRDLVALEDDGIVATLDNGRVVRLGHRRDPGAQR